MGSKSSSTKQTTSNTTNMALDRSTTVRDGTAILDSIIVDPSDEVMKAAMSELRAGFQVMTGNSTFQISEVAGLAKKLLGLIDTAQVSTTDLGYQQLGYALDFLDASQESGALVFSMTEEIVSQSFDFASENQNLSNGLTENALEIVADVKTSDFSSTVKSVTTLVLLFGLGGLYLLTNKV